MRYDQLPANLRAQVDRQLGAAPPTRSRKVATEGTTSRWRCAKCGTVYTTMAAWERSACRRIDVVLAP